MKWQWNLPNTGPHLFLALGATIIFSVDYHVPLGIAMAVPYVTIVLLASTTREPFSAIMWAIVCTILTLLGYYLSQTGSETWFVVLNRVITIYAIWVSAFIPIYINLQAPDSLEDVDSDGVPREILSKSLEDSKDAIIVTDDQGRIKWVNPAFTHSSGFTLEDVLKKNLTEIQQGKASDIVKIRQKSEALNRRDRYESELLQYRKDGTSYWVAESISPTFEEITLVGFVSVQRNIKGHTNKPGNTAQSVTQNKPENHTTETSFNRASENKGKLSQSKLSKAKATTSKDSSDKTEPPENLIEDGTTSILIAEDNNVNSIILTKLLNQLGYQGIDHAEDGSKAVNMALDKHYDIILMDHHMPKMTGLDATNVLLQEHKLPTTIIACTADVSKLVQQQFHDLGVKGVIHKPIDKHMLAEILDESTQQSSTPSNNSTNKGVA